MKATTAGMLTLWLGVTLSGCYGSAPRAGVISCSSCLPDRPAPQPQSTGCADTTAQCIAPDRLRQCDAATQTLVEVPCPFGCDATLRHCRLCQPESTRCDGAELWRCSDDGLSWTQQQVCAGSCHDGACSLCTPGAMRCNGSAMQRCVDTGDDWSSQLPCAADCMPIDPLAMRRHAGQLSAGQGISCAIDSAGVLRCWGSQAYGLFGEESETPERPFVVGNPATQWLAVSSDGFHACAIRADGALFCWGDNSTGQLGLGDTTRRTTPTRVGTDSWTMIAALGGRSCGLKSDGSLWCWGRRDQLLAFYASAPTIETVPTQVGPTDARYSWIELRSETLCAIRQTGPGPAGELVCLGVLHWLKESLATTRFPKVSAEPALVTPGSRWVALSTGPNGFCAIRCDGSLWCASRGKGPLPTEELLPTKVGDGPYIGVVTDGSAHCAVKGDGGLWCWGRGPLGTGDFAPAETPQLVLGDTAATFRRIAAQPGLSHLCTSSADGRVWCWGSSVLGQLGVPDGRRIDAPQRIGSLSDWTWVAVGSSFSCGRRQNGFLYCWGKILPYDAPEPGQIQAAPLLISSVSPAEFAVGLWGVLGTLDDQSLWTWSPQPTFGADWLSFGQPENAHWSVVDGGSSLALCAIGADRRLFCAGTLAPGAPSSSPGPLNDGDSWDGLSVGDGNACAIRHADQSLWCWGQNPNNTLFPGETSSRPLPQKVGDGAWQQIVAAHRYRCGLRTDGTLWCWGQVPGASGTLGTLVLSEPTQVGDEQWAALGNKLPNCAIRLTDRSLWCWSRGDNDANGQHPQPLPVDPSAERQWLMVAGSQDARCGIDSAGALYCWGNNGSGQLGIGYATVLAVPHQLELNP